MAIQRVRTVLTGTVTGGGVATHYFEDDGPGTSTDATELVAAFWTDLAPVISQYCTMTVQAQVDVLDEATGDLLSSSSGIGDSITGTATGDPHPPAINGLMQIQTSLIVAGKRIAGRLFIPSPTPLQGQIRPNTAYRELLAATGQQLASDSASLNPWVVWARSRGTTAIVTGAAGWTEYASLRSRRD